MVASVFRNINPFTVAFYDQWKFRQVSVVYPVTHDALLRCQLGAMPKHFSQPVFEHLKFRHGFHGLQDILYSEMKTNDKTLIDLKRWWSENYFSELNWLSNSCLLTIPCFLHTSLPFLYIMKVASSLQLTKFLMTE